MFTPTYSTKEALIMMCDFDIQGLNLLKQLIEEERTLYAPKDYEKLSKGYEYAIMSEKRKNNLL
jgi:hypothetical protein